MSAERSKLVRVRIDEQKYAQSQWAVCMAPRAARKIIINNTDKIFRRMLVYKLH